MDEKDQGAERLSPAAKVFAKYPGLFEQFDADLLAFIEQEQAEPSRVRRVGCLAWGDYYKPDSSGVDVVTQNARKIFLDAIKKIVPGVLGRLQSNVYPKFVELQRVLGRDSDSPFIPEEELFRLERVDRPESGTAKPGINYYPEYLVLRQSLDAWGQECHLSDMDWLRRHVMTTLSREWGHREIADLHGRHEGKPDYPFDWHLEVVAQGVPVTDFDTRFCLALDEGWVPTDEQWTLFFIRATEEFARFLNEYRSGLVSLVESKGYERAPVKRKPAHFDMLVRRVVQGWPWREIAKRHDLQESSVREAVRVTAALVGIEVPPCKPGRPKKPNPVQKT